MRIKQRHLLFILLFCLVVTAIAQDPNVIPVCNESKNAKKNIGNRYMLSLPKGAIVKTGNDIDYSAYSIGFGKRKNRVWLTGIFGPMATTGMVPKDLISSSVKVTQRTWKQGKVDVVDAKGMLGNGKYWRYFGQVGESIKYENVSAEAAAYFDSILDTICYRR